MLFFKNKNIKKYKKNVKINVILGNILDNNVVAHS